MSTHRRTPAPRRRRPLAHALGLVVVLSAVLAQGPASATTDEVPEEAPTEVTAPQPTAPTAEPEPDVAPGDTPVETARPATAPTPAGAPGPAAPAATEADAGPVSVALTVSQDRDRLFVRAVVTDADGPVTDVAVRGDIDLPWGVGFRMVQVTPGVFEFTTPPRRPDTYTVTVTTSRGAVDLHETSATGRIVGTDGTPPVVSVTAPAQNDRGWYTEPVRVAMSAADPQGIDHLTYTGHPLPTSITTIRESQRIVTYETDGRHTIGVTAMDSLGNQAPTRRLDVRLDTSAPTVDPQGALATGRVAVGATEVLDLRCADPTSGVEACYLLLDGQIRVGNGNQLPTDAAGTFTYEIVAVNNAGLVTTVPGTLEVVADTTPPAVTVQTDPIASNARGWFLRPVTVTITGSDLGSGVAWIEHDGDGTMRRYPASSVTLPVLTDGTHTIRYRAADHAGNVTGERERLVRVDTAGPVIEITSPLDGAVVPVGAELVASYSCEDAVSGLATCVGSSPDGVALATDRTGEFELSVTATDVAGHDSVRVIRYTVVEPVLGAQASTSTPANEAGWWSDDVTVLISPLPGSWAETVHWELDGAQSGSGSSDGHGQVVVAAEGTTRVLYWAENAQGEASEPVSLHVEIDRTAPSISSVPAGVPDVVPAGEVPALALLTGPVVVDVGAEVTWGFGCTDDLSGVTECASDLASGELLPTDVVGTFTVRTWAGDAAGNRAAQAMTYRVVAPGEVDPDEVDPGTGPGGPGSPQSPTGPAGGDAARLPQTGLGIVAPVVVLALAALLGGAWMVRVGRAERR